MNESAHPLDRAAELARAEPVDSVQWQQLASGVMRRIRGTIRPGRALRVPLPDEHGATTRVNERVVVTLLRQALHAVDGMAPSDVRLHVDGERCTGLEIDLVAAYGRDLQVLGAACRAVVAETLPRLLLEDATGVDVQVSVVDVSLGDPQR